MSCNSISSIALGCRDNVGGVSEVYVGNFNGTDMTYILGTGSNDGLITAFSGATVSFSRIEQPKETASWNTPGEFSDTNQGTAWKPSIEVSLYRLGAALSANISTLSWGKWRFIVKNTQGDYFLVGYNTGMTVKSASVGVGKATGDMNGGTVTLEGIEPIPFYQITTAAALSVISM